MASISRSKYFTEIDPKSKTAESVPIIDDVAPYYAIGIL